MLFLTSTLVYYDKQCIVLLYTRIVEPIINASIHTDRPGNNLD